MYVDVDSNNKISIHDITASEALSIATMLVNTPLCSCRVTDRLGKKLLKEASEIIKSDNPKKGRKKYVL